MVMVQPRRPLVVGQAAPEFHVNDTRGNEHTLSQYHGTPLLLSLYRSPDCPLCSLRLYHLRLAYPQLQQLGLRVLVVFEAAPDIVARYASIQQPPFPLVADPQRELFTTYAVRSRWLGMRGVFRWRSYWRARRLRVGGRISNGKLDQLPADVIIGPDGTIAQLYYGKDIGDHLPIPMLVKQLQRR